jgi:hypothetical protein
MISYSHSAKNDHSSKIPGTATRNNNPHTEEDAVVASPTASSFAATAVLVSPGIPKKFQHQRRQGNNNEDSSPPPVTATTTTPSPVALGKVDLTNLMKHIERKEWILAVKFFEKYPHAPKQKTPSGNLPLHEALKHSPPLPVVNLLLQMYEGALREIGACGYLPIHVAVLCRNIGSDVVTRLIMGHPGGLRTREPMKDSLPLHLAVQTGVSEDVLMALLTNYPEGSFIQDNCGRIPIDYANVSVHHHNRSVVALEMAPILLAAAQAAQARVSREYEIKMNGLREAHKEYTLQLEEQFEEERASVFQDQIQLSNELAREKERNISLAEMILELKNSEKSFISQRDLLQVQLDKTISEFRTMIAAQEAELRFFLEEADMSGDNVDDENGKVGVTEDKKASDRDVPENIPLQSILQTVVQGHNDAKAKNLALREELARQKDMVRHLNELLTSKDEELASLYDRLHEAESAHETVVAIANKLEGMHEATVNEINRLKKLADEQNTQLEESKGTIIAQETRMNSIKTLVASLNLNMNSWIDHNAASGREGNKEAHDRSTCLSTNCTIATEGVDDDNVDLPYESDLPGTTAVVPKVDQDNGDGNQNAEEGAYQEGGANEEDSKIAAAKLDAKGNGLPRDICNAISYLTATTVALSMDQEDLAMEENDGGQNKVGCGHNHPISLPTVEEPAAGNYDGEA